MDSICIFKLLQNYQVQSQKPIIKFATKWHTKLNPLCRQAIQFDIPKSNINISSPSKQADKTVFEIIPEGCNYTVSALFTIQAKLLMVTILAQKKKTVCGQRRRRLPNDTFNKIIFNGKRFNRVGRWWLVLFSSFPARPNRYWLTWNTNGAAGNCI